MCVFVCVYTHRQRTDARPHSADWITGMRRWYKGQGRLSSVIWLEGLALRVKELASHQMLSAEVCVRVFVCVCVCVCVCVICMYVYIYTYM